MSRAVGVGWALVAWLTFAWMTLAAPQTGTDGPETDPETAPIWANAACYVCHTTFVKEPLSKVHVEAQVPCIKCHGLSAAHANDEHVGATKPDVIFRRQQIDALCRECHPTHDAPIRRVVARFLQQRLWRKSAAVCTDCHGAHKIEPPPKP